MMKYALLLMATAVSSLAANDLVINWNPNPAGESNILYRVYVSTNTSALTLAGGTTGTTFVIPNIPPGTYCASVTSSNLWQESARSVPVCAVGPVTVPSVPTGVNVFIRVQ